MKKKIGLVLVLIIFLLVFGGLWFYRYELGFSTAKELFTTLSSRERTIHHDITALGALRFKDAIKIGSLVSGTVRSIHVRENQKIKKGALLAEIDNGNEDKRVRETEGLLENAQAQLVYQKAFFARQQALHESGQLSQDEFEKEKMTYQQAKAAVKRFQGLHDFRVIEFKNTRITAPHDGIITSIPVTLGERITTDLDATVLVHLAPDITKMEAGVLVDESDIGFIKKGLKVHLHLESYRDRVFTGVIEDVSNIPKKKASSVFFKVIVAIENKERLLRPGMSVRAKIVIRHVEKAISIPGAVFQIQKKQVQKVAQKLGFSFHELAEKEKQRYTAWIVEENAFREVSVNVGINDGLFYQVIQGIQHGDQLIDDVVVEAEKQ